GKNGTEKTTEGRDVEEERVINQSGEECDAGVLIGSDHGIRRGRVQSRNGSLSGEAREEGRFDGRGLWSRARRDFLGKCHVNEAVRRRITVLFYFKPA